MKKRIIEVAFLCLFCVVGSNLSLFAEVPDKVEETKIEETKIEETKIEETKIEDDPIETQSTIALPAPQFRKEPLTTEMADPIPIPVKEARDEALDKMFADLSNTPVTDGLIEPSIREKHEMWEDIDAEDVYNVEEEGLMTLDFLLERAYEQNPNIKILQSQLNQAKMDVMGAKGMYFPTIKFDGSMSLSSQPLIGPIDIQMGQFGSFPMPSVGAGSNLPNVGGNISLPPEDIRVFDGMPKTFYSFRFSLEQPIFTWGKIPMAVEALKQAVHAAELQLAKTKKEVRAEISISYQALYYIKKISKVIEESKKIMDELLKVTNESYKTGFIIYHDYLDVQVKEQELIKGDFQIKDQYRQILIKLAALTGFKNIDIEMLDFSIIDEEWMPELLSEDEYVELALQNNIDLKLLQVLKDANTLQAQIEKSKGYLKPDFGLQLSLGTMGPDFPFLQRGWYGHNNQNFMASIGFKSTILDGGTILAGAMKKNEELNKTLYQMELGEAEVRSFVARQLSTLDLNQKNMEYFNLKKDSDKKLVDLRKIQYETGGSKLDYLRSQIEFNTGFVDYYSQRIALIQNYYMLLAGVGLL